MNKTIIVGNLGQGAVLKAVGGKDVINFTVAVNESYTGADGKKIAVTSWFECSYWNKANLAEYLTKGVTVAVEGKVSATAYLDKEGQPKASLRMLVSSLSFHGAAKNDNIPDDLPGLD